MDDDSLLSLAGFVPAFHFAFLDLIVGISSLTYRCCSLSSYSSHSIMCISEQSYQNSYHNLTFPLQFQSPGNISLRCSLWALNFPRSNRTHKNFPVTICFSRSRVVGLINNIQLAKWTQAHLFTLPFLSVNYEHQIFFLTVVRIFFLTICAVHKGTLLSGRM